MLVVSQKTVVAYELKDGAHHVFPGDDLQTAVDLAADHVSVKIVRIHEGTYAPAHKGQALLFLNRRHDGVRVEGIGRPTLTAQNPALSPSSNPPSPAIVNHVVYLGDGLSSNTVLAHLRITGANHFVTNSRTSAMEPDQELKKGRFYFGDGGAIKIYHRSYPVLRDLEIVGNYASPCAGGISIQHESATQGAVLIEDCVFRNNRAEVTGAALDLLWGSSARVINCMFAANVSNTGPGEGVNPFSNNGAVTVFAGSRLIMEHCTLKGNRNGIDDMSGLSQYTDCLFSDNTLDGGFTPQPRFELDLARGGLVRRCVINGVIRDPQSVIRPEENRVGESAPISRNAEAKSWVETVGYHSPGRAAKPQ